MADSCHAIGGARHRCSGAVQRYVSPTGLHFVLCVKGRREWLKMARESGHPDYSLRKFDRRRDGRT